MDNALAAWQHYLSAQTDCRPATVAEYVADVQRFIVWIAGDLPQCRPVDVSMLDAKAYRQFLLDTGRAPATINRSLVSLNLFFDAVGRKGDNPFRGLERIAQREAAPKALTRHEWNAVRRAAEHVARRDQGLALALVSLIRYAGPRVAEVAALQLSDLVISPRRGLLIIRQAKGLKHREVPLIQEARDALQPYLAHRQTLADHWYQKALLRKQPPPVWACWPQGHLFLGQRGPLTPRGIRDIVAQIGVAAKVEDPLHPHALRHTFATALLDPPAYGSDRPPATLPAVQALLGHSDLNTTAIYTRASHADLARMMGEPDQSGQ